MLDVSEPEAIAQFASEYGVLGIRTDGFAAIRDVPETDEAIQRLRAAIDKAKDGASDVHQWRDDHVRVETVVEFQFAAALLHDLTSLLFIARGSQEKPGWRALEDTGDSIELALESSRLDAGYLAADALTTALNPALAPFQPRLMVRDPKTYEDLPTTPRRAVSADFASASLYSVCALELFNHVVEEAEYKRCANESCRRLFVRQEGRARAEQYRTKGVEFCSERCLRQQKQREYRQRKREENHGHQPSSTT